MNAGRRETDDIQEQVSFIKNHIGRMSWGARLAALGVASSLCGTLYGGFLMYQKVESIAQLDVEAYQQQMEIMDAKVTEAVDYARDIKNGLRDDILRIEQQTDRVEDMVRDSEENVRVMIDKANDRFESQRERLRSSQSADLKELEDKLNKKMQEFLDNPLAQ